ncbi:MAG TPA: class I SAM-dependent RNA methyltransferase [Pseudonocardiaceae bacterium]|jgi:tRNA/tmRNA/rRNA uracil-C5-methylase (TrmA/RlmC/RlmD family)|nr:class I SAM-dependent RNA methyltransferase [Pseudonocardiaceae bacterium]
MSSSGVATDVGWLARRFEVEVGAVAHGGHCVARAEGRVLFVRHALPGEQVIVEVTEDRGGSFCRADAVEILTPSPDRVTPPCALSGPAGCGGCDWQHASPAAQRELKAFVVVEQLRRLAGLDIEVRVEELPGGSLGWRTRQRLAVDKAGRAGLRVHHSHRILPLADNVFTDPLTGAGELRGCPISVPDLFGDVLDTAQRPDTELDVVLDDTGEQHVASLAPIPTRSNRGAKKFRTHWLRGGTATQHAADRDWLLHADGFWQGHPAAAQTLAEVVAEFAATPVGGSAWDLYGGVGLFAAVLAEQVGPSGSVLLIESVPSAVEDAERNLVDLPWVRYVTGRVEHVLVDGTDLAAGGVDIGPDVVVLDPPRKGAGKAVVDAIASEAPLRVVYVACDPAALARDVAGFAEHGYRLSALRAFDAFPMTHHVECVALLER